MGSRVAVQASQRFYREGLVAVFAAEPDLEVVGAAIDASSLTRVFEAKRPDIAVIELDAPDWDACRLAAALCKRRHSLAVIGIAHSCDRILAMRANQAGVRAVVTRDRGIGALLQALRTPRGRPVVVDLSPSTSLGDNARNAAASLTQRQLEVLRLVGAGLTTREISGRLFISPKTVENHKQRIFERLDVHNQAHAVAVAMRTGLISYNAPAASRRVS